MPTCAEWNGGILYIMCYSLAALHCGSAESAIELALPGRQQNIGSADFSLDEVIEEQNLYF